MIKKYKYIPISYASVNADNFGHELASEEDNDSYFESKEEAYKDLKMAKEKADEKYDETIRLLNNIPRGVYIESYNDSQLSLQAKYLDEEFYLSIEEKDYTFNYRF